jgi:hypothetical protein
MNTSYRKLFDAVRPSSCDLVSKSVDGSKTLYQRANEVMQ